jgi:hypothetical protein
MTRGKIEGEAIPVSGRGAHRFRETSRLPHFLDHWLANGREDVRLIAQAALYPQGRFVVLIFVIDSESSLGP